MEILYLNNINIKIEEKYKFKFLLIPISILIIAFTFPDYYLINKIVINDLIIIIPIFIFYFLLLILIFYPNYHKLLNQNYTEITRKNRAIFSTSIILPFFVKYLSYFVLNSFNQNVFNYTLSMTVAIITFLLLIVVRFPNLAIGKELGEK